MKERYTLPIGRIREEGKDVRTFTFFHDLGALPGQFVMLTDFRGGEKPFSIADSRRDEFSITVKRVGEFTRRLFCCSAGDYLSFRGAYGSSFFISPGKTLLVGGGFGIPPLTYLARILKDRGSDVTVVNAARTKTDLLLADKFTELGLAYREATDDGSRGYHGTAVDLVREVLAEDHFDFVYAAGPELMMKNLMPLLEPLEYQFLMERYMKCAVGLCGACVMDPSGIRICREGPALRKDQIKQLTEFGSYHRDAAGRKHPYKTKSIKREENE